jgi:phosphoglycerate dehydrogenase-like enzyme
MLRCAVLDDYQRVARTSADWTELRERVSADFFHEPLGDAAAIASALARYEIVVAMRERTPFPRTLIERLPALKLLVTTAMRNASIDVGAAHERGVTVCGTRSHPGPATELTWALILALARGLPAEIDAVRSGGWQRGLGRSLNGATLGIVGLGKIGTQMASVARAFDMHVVGWSRSLTGQRAAGLGVAYAPTLDDLLRDADIVTIHVTLTPQTRGLIGARELALMKRDALLVNTSRGPIVDEHALIEAMMSRLIAGAALDVFDREPLPADHPLRTLPKRDRDAACRLRHAGELPRLLRRRDRGHPGVARRRAGARAHAVDASAARSSPASRSFTRACSVALIGASRPSSRARRAT